MKEQDSENTPTPMLGESLVPSTDSSDPKTITDRYTVIDRLGQGGMGRVYTAYDSRLDRTVAIKILFGTVFKDDYWKRFQQEAKAASKLKHPGIVQVLDFGLFGDNEPYLSMEYVDGKTLTEYIKAYGPLDLEDALSIVGQICASMEDAHKHGVLHRDLKPANLIVTGEGEGLRVQILDFGVAKVVDNASAKETLTKTGQVVGSPRYMSPEQAMGGAVDSRSDVYALGCIAYELLTGRPPYMGQSAMETIAKHLFDDVPKLNDVEGVDLPKVLEELVARALSKEPVERYSSMAAFKLACDQCLSQVNSDGHSDEIVTDNHEAMPYSIKHQIQKNSALVVGVVVLAVFALTISVVFLNPDKPKDHKEKMRAVSKVSKKNTGKPIDPKETALSLDSGFDQLEGQALKKFGLDNYDGLLPANGDDAINQLKNPSVDRDTIELIFLTDAKLDEAIGEELCKYPKLRKVRLERVVLTKVGLNSLSKCKNLSNFQIIESDISIEELRLLKSMPLLRFLKLQKVPMDDSYMKELSKFEGLKLLKLAYCDQVTSKSLAYFADRSNFRISIVHCKKIPQSSLEHLSDKYRVVLTTEE